MDAERTVRFYELVDEDGDRFKNDLPFSDLMTAVAALSDAEAYVKLSRFEVLGSVHSPTAGPKPAVPLIMLDRITRDVGLRVERRRNYRPLTLAADETLAEPAYYSIFARNVVGVMRNSGQAPGPASLRDYLNRTGLLGDTLVNIAPLSDANILRAVSEVGRLTKVHLAVGTDVAAEALADERGFLAPVVKHFRDRVGNVKVEVTVTLTGASNSEASEGALEAVRDIVQDEDNLSRLTKADIAYRRMDDGMADTYDFMNEAVAMAEDVVLSDSGGQPTERSAAEAIASAYDVLYDDIQSALNAAGDGGGS